MNKILILKSYFLIISHIIFAKFLGKKTIIFHHPNKNLTLVTDYYIKDLFDRFKKKYLIIYTHESKLLKKKNYFYITQWYLKFIIGVDFFISSYVCDHFTSFSKKIYIHHDIYDTPISSASKKKVVVNKIIKYDFVFVSSNITKNMFTKFFQKSHLKKIPQIIKTGYIKLDYLIEKIKDRKIPNYIIIAPTNIHAFKNSYLIFKLKEIIRLLLNFNYNVVLRPHPSNINDKKFIDIKKTFKKNKKFSFNKDKNYISIYSKSLFMVTDISGTAYTFSFLTQRPVVFFEKKLKNKSYKKQFFFKDRNKIGYVCNSLHGLVNFTKNIKKNSKKYKLMIKDLKHERLSNFGNVKDYIYKFIEMN